MTKFGVVPLSLSLSTVAVVLSLTGCSKSLQYMSIKYKNECTGDLSVRCKSMQIDVNMLLVDATMDKLVSEREAIIQCSGQERFDRAIQLWKERKEWYESQRPNFLLRWFKSDAQLQPSFASFPKEGEQEALKLCKGQRDSVLEALSPSAAAAEATATSTPSIAPEAFSRSASDSQAATAQAVESRQPLDNAMTIVAGKLEVRQDDPQQAFGRKLFLNGNPLPGVEADFVNLIKKFTVKDRDIVVVTTGCSGSACSFTNMTLLEFGPRGLLSQIENNKNSKDSDPISGDGQEPTVAVQPPDSLLFTYDGYKGRHQVLYRYGEGFREVH